MNMRTKLLETLVRKCVREVLDQVEEEANASKLKSSDIGKNDNKKPTKQKLAVKPFVKGKKSKVNISHLDEAENPEQGGGTSSTDIQGTTGDQPSTPKDEPKPEEKPQEPEPSLPSSPVKGAVVINPKDKSKLQPIRWQGRDESSIERTLHQIAVSIAGPRTKVSIGAKRLAREISTNPNAIAYFYFGKIDPESEEIFLMADKSLQIAKNDSVQSTDLMGTSVSSSPSPTLNYGSMTDDEYSNYINTRNQARPRYGIDENTKGLIKKLVNQILNK